MKTRKIALLSCAALVATGIGLNIQNALADYGIGENSFSLVAVGSGSNSNSNWNSNTDTNPGNDPDGWFEMKFTGCEEYDAIGPAGQSLHWWFDDGFGSGDGNYDSTGHFRKTITYSPVYCQKGGGKDCTSDPCPIMHVS